MKCFSAFVDFIHIKKLFTDIKYSLFLNESRQRKILSQHNCLSCKTRMGIHFMGKNIQVETCFNCQKIWFDPSEIQKFQKEYEIRLVNPALYTAQKPPDKDAFSAGLFNSGWAHLDPHLATKFYLFETTTNYVGNKITDTKFFKKYPILTFFLVVAVVVLYFMITRD